LEDQLKFLSLGVLVSVIFCSQYSRAGCSNKPGPDGLVEKCLPAGVLDSADEDLKRREAMASWMDQVFKFNNLTTEEIFKYCTMVKEESSVKSLAVGTCQGDNGLKLFTRTCQFKATLNCNVKGEVATIIRRGSCVGQMHDCGTFKYCAEDEAKFTCPDNAWKNAKADSFHTEDSVPKGLPKGLNPQVPGEKVKQ
jgi:hypothetical protein